MVSIVDWFRIFCTILAAKKGVRRLLHFWARLVLYLLHDIDLSNFLPSGEKPRWTVFQIQMDNMMVSQFLDVFFSSSVLTFYSLTAQAVEPWWTKTHESSGWECVVIAVQVNRRHKISSSKAPELIVSPFRSQKDSVARSWTCSVIHAHWSLLWAIRNREQRPK